MIKHLLLLSILGGLIGCNAFNGYIQPGTGQLVLKITDAPGDLNISHMNITIARIQVHRSAVGNNTTAGWFTVVDTSQTFDLVSLHNITNLLGSAILSAGWYTQIRLFVTNTVLTIDGKEQVCKIPSRTIKLIKPFRIIANTTTTLTLDFDIQTSIHETGNSKYLFKPVIKIIQG